MEHYTCITLLLCGSSSINHFWNNNPARILVLSLRCPPRGQVGTGDDFAYPTEAPPMNASLYRARLALMKQYGFDFVRLHSHFEAPGFFEAADEVGMIVRTLIAIYELIARPNQTQPKVPKMSSRRVYSTSLATVTASTMRFP